MKMRFAALALLLFGQSQAQALTVSFIQQTGVVSPTESIDVMIRVTADADFAFDGNDPDNNYGIDPFLIPTEGLFFSDDGPVFIPFEEITVAFTSISYVCSGSFSDGGANVCPPGNEYDFTFNTTGTDTFSGADAFSLAAGESEDFLFGTFTPLDGSAAPGDYNFFGANITLFFGGIGTDQFGNIQEIFQTVTLATTCATGDTSCAFSRTVVPVPGAVWLFASAMGGLIGARRRRNV